AIDVDIAAREMRPHQGVAAAYHADRELVDEAVLRSAQGRHVEARGRQEGPWVHVSTVRGVEHDRPAPLRRLEGLEGRVELVFQLGHAVGFKMTSAAMGPRGGRIARPDAPITIAGNAPLSMGLSMRRGLGWTLERFPGRVAPRFTRSLPRIPQMG